MLFLWLWFVADLVFLTISGGKRKHYVIPAIPPLAILIGIIMEDMAFVRMAFTQKLAKNFLLYHMVFITTSAVGGMIYMTTAHPEFLFETLTLGLIALAMAGGITVSFAKRRAAVACGVLFGSYCILTICYINVSTPFNNNNYTRKFGLAISEKVPITDNLVAYGYVSPRVVHYFARPVPEIEDKSLLYQHYERGDWVLATAGELEELEQDNRLKKAYYNENAEMRKKGNTRGALFHKSASKDKGDT